MLTKVGSGLIYGCLTMTESSGIVLVSKLYPTVQTSSQTCWYWISVKDQVWGCDSQSLASSVYEGNNDYAFLIYLQHNFEHKAV